MSTKVCSIVGCKDKHKAKGFCNRHYEQQPKRVEKKRLNYSKHRPRTIQEDKLRNEKPSRRFTKFKAHANKRGIPLQLTLEEFSEIIAKDCYYCGGSLAPTGCGMDRIDHDLAYHKDNVIPCCKTCNRFRGHYLSKSEMEIVVATLQNLRGTLKIWESR